MATARDSGRVTDITNIYTQLKLTSATALVPKPDSFITLTASGTTIGYQGYAGKAVLAAIQIEKGGKDPKDNTYYTYTADATNSYFEVLAYFESQDTSKLSFRSSQETPLVTPAYADSIDYTVRKPGITGRQLGVFLSSGTLVPAQDA